MNVQKVLLASLAGGVVNFFLGFVIFSVALGSFYAAHVGSEGAMRTEPVMWAIAVGCLLFGGLLAYIYDRWAGIKTAATGAKAGAVIGLLVGLADAFWRYGGSFAFDGVVPVIVDGLAMAVLSALTGAAVGWVLGRGGDA